ncbi:hypothetical protein CHUAL_012088 [Chamberlinius hualienensis]
MDLDVDMTTTVELVNSLTIVPKDLVSIVDQLSEAELESVKEIQKWLKNQAQNLYFNPRTDDDFVLKYLLGCKFNLDKTKSKIIRYYQLRKKYPQWYKNRNFNQDDELLDYIYRGILSADFDVVDEKERLVVLINLSRLKPSDDVYCLLRLSVILVDAMLLRPQVQKHGVVFILDVSGVPLSVITQANPKFLYRYVRCVLMGMPMRVKAIHFIKINPAVMAIIKTFKLFLSEKLKKRIYIYGKIFDSLFDEVPRHCIPDDYGGTGGPFASGFDKMMADFDKVIDYLIDDEKYGYI